MRRIITIIGAAALALGILVGPAAASGHLFPAQNQNACDAAGGTFTRDASLRTCVVTSGPTTETVTLRESGQSGNSWESTVTVVTVTTYTRDGSTMTDTVTTSRNVISCTNPGGQLMEPGQGQCPTNL